jgi:hypothetical protein
MKTLKCGISFFSPKAERLVAAIASETLMLLIWNLEVGRGKAVYIFIMSIALKYPYYFLVVGT